MLLGKLCEGKDKTVHCTCTGRCSPTVRNAKINLQNNTHNSTSTTHPTLSFYLRETYRICNILTNCCDYTHKQNKAPISLSPEVYETSSKTGSGIRILYLLTGPIRIGPLCFQAGSHKRQLNLAFVFFVCILCCSTFVLICEFVLLLS